MSPSSSLPDLTGVFVDEGYLQLVEMVGCGGSAKVYKAIDTTSPSDDPAYFAVKCMKNGERGSHQVALLNNEFRMHGSVARHPGVLSFHRCFVERGLVFVVFDLCAADMLDCVIKYQLYVGRPALVKQAFVELLDVVDYCHQKGIFHRDLKPQNVLCNSAGTDIRLADFGTATRQVESRDFKVGTPGYMSPGSSSALVSFPHAAADHLLSECSNTLRASYSPRQSDMWGLAVTLVVLATGHVPWLNAEPSNASYAAFRAHPDTFLRQRLALTSEANDLLRWCFHVNPARRPSIAELRVAVLAIDHFSVADIPRKQVPTTADKEPTLIDAPAEPSVHSGLNAVTEKSSAIDGPPHPAVLTASSATSSDGTLVSDSAPPSLSTVSSSSSSAGPPTPPTSSLQPPVAIVDLLDAANIGLAALYPEPLKPTKMYGGRVIPPPKPSHLKSAPEYRFLDLKRRGVANRQRFADRQRRTF
ncbi:kinase-like domain-containing protein [Mycena vulgaris]|nr:kinase-like domain-containing protein [Mycena vulgaris]